VAAALKLLDFQANFRTSFYSLEKHKFKKNADEK
jgi:hypothetical protein